MARARKTKAGSYEVTERQAQVLETVRNYLMLRGFPPTRAEIGRALGLKHQSAVDNHLHALAKKKYLELSPGVERGIRLLRLGVPLYEPEHYRRGSTTDVGNNTEHAEPVWLNYPQLWPVFGSTPDVCMRVRGRDMGTTGLTEGADRRTAARTRQRERRASAGRRRGGSPGGRPAHGQALPHCERRNRGAAPGERQPQGQDHHDFARDRRRGNHRCRHRPSASRGRMTDARFDVRTAQQTEVGGETEPELRWHRREAGRTESPSRRVIVGGGRQLRGTGATGRSWVATPWIVRWVLRTHL